MVSVIAVGAAIIRSAWLGAPATLPDGSILLEVPTANGPSYHTGNIYPLWNLLRRSDSAYLPRKDTLTELQRITIDREALSRGARKNIDIIFLVESKQAQLPQTIYFRWHGQLRSAPFTLLQEITELPAAVRAEQLSGRAMWYTDRNKDGVIDEKAEGLGSHLVLYWIDTDNDGWFDKEYLDAWPSGRSMQRTIKVQVPRVE